MTFDSLLSEVYALTARPDLVAETESAIKAATLKAHHTDFFPQDIYETKLKVINSGFIHSIDYPAIISNFRALKYIRKIDIDGDAYGKPFTIITPSEILDSYAVTRNDVAYVAGRLIELRSSNSINALLFGCYVNPVVTKLGYSSWVAQMYPYAIVYEAARIVFNTIGHTEQSTRYRVLAAEQAAVFSASALAVGGGY